MLLCRFNENRLGVVQGQCIRDVTAALDCLPNYRYPLPSCDPLVEHLDTLTVRIQTLLGSAPTVAVESVTLLSPIANPGKIIGAPVNYQDHLQEATSQEELHHGAQINGVEQIGFFLKATSSLVGASEGVTMRYPDRRNDHEIELVVIIGKKGNKIASKDALAHVAGYAIGLDMTVRGLEERSMRKSIDTYSVLGPWLATADEISDPGTLDISLSVNGHARQMANTSDLIIGIPKLIEHASSFYSLHPGDLLFTGTPAGVGPVKAGDRIKASISGIGSMDVSVHA
jgi:2,4-didehydro-3-deoxy-L-rhamnonate hydrolase